MDQSLSSMTFKGSITEAISEAKRQKKLFVVYVSGDDADSSSLERSTWRYLKVTESVSKYCILLHIPAGSADATQFSAIYPQKSVPCITAVGYNGMQLWQHEGYISADDLASSLEKAWLSLHIQETTATVLTAALASKKSEAVSNSTSGTSTSISSDLGTSSSTIVFPTDHPSQTQETKSEVTPEEVKEDTCPEQAAEQNNMVDERSETFISKKSKNVSSEGSSASTEATKDLLLPLVVDLDNSRAHHIPDEVADGCSVSQKLTGSCESGGSQLNVAESNGAQDERAKGVEEKKDVACDKSTRVNTSDDVNLNIRLLNGVSLQEKFSMSSTLRMVKDYVDKNQASGSGSYDLAIPYPRKVFTDNDLSKSLSELGLFNRQAMIVVPHQRLRSDNREGSLPFDRRKTTTTGDSSDENREGYFAYVRRILSYANPFSYFGGGDSSSNPRQESQSDTGPNTARQGNFLEADRPYSHYQPNQGGPVSGRNDGKSKQPTTSQIGSNIHTLKHDEDDPRFNDGNSFWNGNSTQYGGNGDGQ